MLGRNRYHALDGYALIKCPRDERQLIAVTRCKHIHVRSDAAPTTMEGGSAGFAGAKTCHAAYGYSNKLTFTTLMVCDYGLHLDGCGVSKSL